MAQVLSNLPVGALIKFGKHQVGSETAQPIIWAVADKNHKGYPSNSVTLITQKIIDLRAYDAKESGKTNGNTSYPLSNIHAWLNSSKGAGEWYTATHSEDAPPSNSNTQYTTGYDTRPGFLYNFTASERLAILPTTLTAPKNIYTLTANVFLPTVWETIGTYDVEDGTSKLAYFNSVTCACGLTSQAYNNTSSTSKPSSASTDWYYWTRTEGTNSIYCVQTRIGCTLSSPRMGDTGVRPIVNLTAKTKISDTVDSDGCYTVLSQSAPVILGSNSNLGVKGNYYTEANGFPATLGFTQTYTVTDADNDTVTVTEYIDNVKVRSFVTTLGATNTFDVTGKTWVQLANGTHTLKIVASDGFDEYTRTYTFTKSVDMMVAQRSSPIEASTMPTYVNVTVAKNIPEGAVMKVYACNNGFDTKVVWEEVEPGVIHKFTNAAKTAGKWGVNVKVTVKRNGAEGACYITEIGGNFK